MFRPKNETLHFVLEVKLVNKFEVLSKVLWWCELLHQLSSYMLHFSSSHSSAELNTPVAGGLLWTQNDFHKIKSGLQLF